MGAHKSNSLQGEFLRNFRIQEICRNFPELADNVLISVLSEISDLNVSFWL